MQMMYLLRNWNNNMYDFNDIRYRVDFGMGIYSGQHRHHKLALPC